MIHVNKIKIGSNSPFVLIAGPCVIENEKITMNTAEEIKKITGDLNIPSFSNQVIKKPTGQTSTPLAGFILRKHLKFYKKLRKNFLFLY